MPKLDQAAIALRNLRILAILFVSSTAIYAAFTPLHQLENERSLCMSKMIFNVSCAGCGFTKGMVAFWQLEWTKAWHYHAFTFVLMGGCLWLLASSFSKKASAQLYEVVNRTGFWMVALGTFIGYFIYRLAMGTTV